MKKRQSAAETRAAMVGIGTTWLAEHGMTASLDELTIDRALGELDGLARSSAYNAWSDPEGDHTPQQRFQREVIRAIIEEPTITATFDPAKVAEHVLANTPGIISRSGLRQEMIRVLSAGFMESIQTNRTHLSRMSLLYAASSAPATNADDELLAWFAEAESIRRANLLAAFKPLASVLGLRPRSSVDGENFWDQVCVAATSFAIGLYARHRLYPIGMLDDIARSEGDGTERSWTLFGLGLDAMVIAYFEPDPDASSPILDGLAID